MATKPTTAHQKLVVILGPTSAGKSGLSLKLAKKFKGEIISADSRQVYKGMDLGTGKVTKQEQKIAPHHLLDVANPKKQFTVAQFKKLADKALKEIYSRKHLPFIVGGSAFYIYALIDNQQLPEVKPNIKLRAQLAKKTPAQLFSMLKKLDPNRAATIDAQNSRRLIRALEIIKATGQPTTPLQQASNNPNHLILGITKELPELYKLIDKRLKQRLDAGMINEVKKLLKQGVSHKQLKSFGLEYKYLSLHLQNKLSYDETLQQLEHASHHFAKRQMTWFKRDSRIHWIKNYSDAERLIKKFLE